MNPQYSHIVYKREAYGEGGREVQPTASRTTLLLPGVLIPSYVMTTYFLKAEQGVTGDFLASPL